jgi:hypothetical protein
MFKLGSDDGNKLNNWLKNFCLRRTVQMMEGIGGLENGHQRFDGVFASARCFKGS